MNVDAKILSKIFATEFNMLKKGSSYLTKWDLFREARMVQYS